MKIFFLCKRAKKRAKSGRRQLGVRKEEGGVISIRNEKLGIGGRVGQETKTFECTVGRGHPTPPP